MGPIVKEVAAAYTDKSIEFVTFDFTTDEGKEKARADATAYGINQLFVEHAYKTGYLLLVDTGSGKVVGRLSANDDAAAWRAAIDKALGQG